MVFPFCTEAEIHPVLGKLREVQTMFEIDTWLLQFQNQPLRRLENLTLILISHVGALGEENQLGSQSWQGRLVGGCWLLAGSD